MKRCTLIGSLSLCLLSSAVLAENNDFNLGQIDFPVSCNAAAQDEVTQGTLLLHHMMYRMAEARFKAAAAADSSCAMAQWGVAMSNFHPLWPGIQSPQERENGLAAIAEAANLDAVTSLEKAYLSAAASFYDPAFTTFPERKAAWATKQRQVYDAYPENPDAAAFAALAMLATAPPGDKTFALQREAGALLENLHATVPLHPGALHYLVHAYDHPPLAASALPYVQLYLELAPENPHALHMPSHIMTRLGRWEEAADLNRRSAAAVLAQPAINRTVSNHYPHALDYLTYALLQMGEFEAATDVVETLLGTTGMQDVFGTAYAVAAAPARLALEQQDWEAAAILSDIPYEGLEWERYPHALAIVAFAQGYGAARSGNAESAQVALSRLAELSAIMAERGMGYWLKLAKAQSTAIEGWIAYEAGNPETALKKLKEAARIEDSVGKAPVTPSHVLPAREQLGDLLLLLGEPGAAKEAFDAALAISPNRRRSLTGKAEASGD